MYQRTRWCNLNFILLKTFKLCEYSMDDHVIWACCAKSYRFSFCYLSKLTSVLCSRYLLVASMPSRLHWDCWSSLREQIVILLICFQNFLATPSNFHRVYTRLLQISYKPNFMLSTLTNIVNFVLKSNSYSRWPHYLVLNICVALQLLDRIWYLFVVLFRITFWSIAEILKIIGQHLQKCLRKR